MLRFLFALILIPLTLTAAAQFNFNLGSLSGTPNLGNPTTLQFGPDGKLYVGNDVGRILRYTIVKNGNNYTATNEEIIDLVLNIPNHNDDLSTYTHYQIRQVTGILVMGTAQNPVIYVTSSDPRVGGGGTAGDVNLDTNSGIVSKLTWNGSSWEKVDLVRGFPRSEENHSVNGMQYDESTNTLYVAVGGNTNAGGPSNNFAYLTEYAYATAIVSIDMNVINSLPVRGSGNNKYIYDLPTLNDPTRQDVSNPDYNPSLPGSPQTMDVGDPFGGNDGKNQAKLVPGGPVQIYSPGYRNIYDILITKTPGREGRMYTIDNGANGGWGGYPKNRNTPNVTNEYRAGEPGSTGADGSIPVVNNLDNMHLVSKPGMSPIYGGHPNPIRANPAGAGLYTHNGSTGTFSLNPTTDWPPVPLSMADPREANFLMPGLDDGAMTTFPGSTNGLDEYKSTSFFNAQLVGEIFAADFSGPIWKMKLSADGTQVVSKEAFANGFASIPLDLTIQGDNVIFPGTIWVTDYGASKIYIFTPDPNSGGNCTGNNTSWSLDDDNDGYKNADEADNGTNPCNPLSFPGDFDNDKVSDKNDNDDDNDGILDISDVFHRDAANGQNSGSTILYPFLNGNPGTGLFGLGFTGLMSNGSTDPDQLYDPTDPGVIMGGAVGLASFPADQGNASSNNQHNGFQFGYKVNSSAQAFTVQTSLIGPFFNGLAAGNLNENHRQGIYIGTGNQDNYFMVAISGAAGGGVPGVRLFMENGGAVNLNTLYPDPAILNANNIYFYLDVNPATGSVAVRYNTDINTAILPLGSPVQLGGALLNALQSSSAIAVGLIAHSGNSNTFAAKWDYVNILTTSPAVVNPIPDQNTAMNTPTHVVNLTGVFTDDGGASNLTLTVSGNTNPSLITGAAINGNNLTLTIAPNQTGVSQIKVKATDLGGLFAEDGFFISVNDNTTPSVAINAGGPALTQGNFSADQYFSGGSTYENIVPISNTSNQALYQTERWGNMSYTIPVNNGSYTVKLHFAEIYFTGAGQRVFNTNIENNQGSLSNYDVFAKAGGVQKAIVETFNNIVVADGALNIAFTGVVDNAKISAIEIIPSGGGSNAPPVIANPVQDQQATANAGTHTVNLSNVFSDDGGASNLTLTVNGNTNTALITAASISGNTLTLTIASGQTGSSQITVKATDAQGLFVEDQFVMNVIAAPAATNKYINAAGPSVTLNGITWAADNSFSGGSTYSTGSAIANTTLDQLYQTERFGNFNYSIPVVNGNYIVKLHFAEIYFTSPGLRVFNVNVENGQGILSNYDIYSKTGAINTAVIETFNNVNVSDGTLNISFSSVVDNAKISAIEIITNSVPPLNTAPVVASPVSDQSLTVGTSGLNVPLASVFTDDGGAANITLSVSGNTNTALVTAATISGTNLVLTFGSGQTGTALIKLKATDAQGLFAEDEFAVSVTPAPSPSNKYINSAGPSVTLSGITWSADNSFSGGSTYSTSAAIANTTLDALYQTERYGNFSYAIPLTSGNYTVKLHFAEIFFTSPGLRVFNVNVEGGQAALTNYDIYSKSGAINTAVVETFSSVNVTDGTLNISFTSVVNNAKISAIEVIANGAPVNTPPVVSNPIADQSVVVNTASLVVNLSNTFSDNGGAANLTLSVSGNNNTGLVTSTGISGNNLTLNFAPGVTGNALIKVKATDAQGLFVEDEFSASVITAPPASSKFINAGGPSVTLSGTTWAADNSFSGGSTFTTTSAIANTTLDALYQSERWGNFTYSIPVTNTTYTVKLHFAEIYHSSTGSRVFNVNIEGGKGVLNNYDIFSKTGAKNSAVIETFNNISVTDGVLNISFTSVVDNAKISAIEIIPNAGTRIALNDVVFTTEVQNGKVEIDWSAESPADEVFTIERSADGFFFQPVSNAVTGKGKKLSQHFTDQQPLPGISYYRLKSVDRKGTDKYSVTRTVVFDGEVYNFMLYPNPNTTGTVFMEIPKVDGPETLNVRLLNMQGAVVYRKLQAERNTPVIVRLSLPQGIAAGTYIVEVERSGKLYHSRLVVQ